jgi:hypothetical protein
VSIAELTGLHRHTSTKYIHELIGAGVLYQREIGPARLCYLKEEIKDEKQERKLLIDLEKRRFGQKSIAEMKYQIKFLAAIAVAILLLTQAPIIAQNLTHFLNDSNKSLLTGESTLANGTPQILENLQEVINEDGLNITVENTTVPITSISIPLTSTTVEIPLNYNTANSIDDVYPLQVSVDVYGKITRGELIKIKATIYNPSSFDAKNVLVDWQLPTGFQVLSTEGECGTIATNSSCEITANVQSFVSAELGKNEIKVVVSYE